MKYRNRTYLRMFFYTMMLSIGFAACSKSETKDLKEDGTSTVIYDLPGDTTASLGDDTNGKEQRPFYTILFSFKTQQVRWVKTAADSASYLKNLDWDIAFSKEYNSYVVVNNGAIAGTPGYGGPGLGKILIIEKPYDQVLEAPSGDQFENQGIAGVGWDSGNGYGWFFYSLDNHICVPIKNRTFVLKTATGKYAKLELLNVYKGNPPVVTDLFWPAPYFTFRYFVQEDGSRDLKTQ
ncbi:hypothetical protein COR50_16620 [Chitinophaga caeni]|uniref:HmuY protein n=1 Tax=Chitinophaga caeni TaxID=2029983 RepID=A0A291R1A0_9BACT|nr:HmuY family protein [Chitinophaga caeni]ATL49922.1 hypothetical protein COR50_16620 [Chitinophaga caeni]